MRARQRRTIALTGAAALMLVAAGLVFAIRASISPVRPCAGQCGPPFQLVVTFRTGSSAEAAETAMSNCASKPFVVRIGSAHRRRDSLTATVYTEAMHGHQSDHLLACLHRSPSVFSAGYPD